MSSKNIEKIRVNLLESLEMLTELHQTFNNLQISNCNNYKKQVFDKNSIHTCGNNLDINFSKDFDETKVQKIIKIYKESSNVCSNTLTSKVHPFRSFEELLHLKETEIYVNSNIKTLGLYKFAAFNSRESEKCHTLEGKNKEKIILNLKFQNIFPSNGSNIIVYGDLNFKQFGFSKRICIDVKFWKYVSHMEVYQKYFSNQNILRPKMLDSKVNMANFEDTNFFETTNDNLFDTIDNSLFIKSIEEDENLFYEIEDLMAIEVDLFN